MGDEWEGDHWDRLESDSTRSDRAGNADSNSCDKSVFIQFVALRSESYVSLDYDDSAMTNVRMKCSDEEVLEAKGDSSQGGSPSWGVYNHMVNCPDNFAISGVRQKIQKDLGDDGDDTSVNKMEFVCTSLDKGRNDCCRNVCQRYIYHYSIYLRLFIQSVIITYL